MTEPSLQSDPVTNAEPAGAPPAAPRGPVTKGARGVNLALVVAVLAIAAVGWQTWEMRERMLGMQDELARRLATSDTSVNETRLLVRNFQDSLRAVQERIGALDGRLDQMQGQQGALDALYQELARTRDDRLLAEVEQVVTIANQHLQLAGNVEAALLALQTADGQLARADRAHFLPLRKAINRDIDRLKALPAVDVPGLTLKIESLLATIDGMPLAFDKKPAAPTARAVPESVGGLLSSLMRDVWQELRNLVRIERLDRPDPGLLAPGHAVFLRENLKLRLLDARLALLQRDSRLFNEDIKQARVWVEKYFDTAAAPTRSALESFAQLSGVKLSIDLPVLTDSMVALKSLKALPERAPLKPATTPAGH